jgi:hypothetical protein
MRCSCALLSFCVEHEAAAIKAVEVEDEVVGDVALIAEPSFVGVPICRSTAQEGPAVV